MSAIRKANFKRNSSGQVSMLPGCFVKAILAALYRTATIDSEAALNFTAIAK